MTTPSSRVDSDDTGLRERTADVRGREALVGVWRIGIGMSLLLVVFAFVDALTHPPDQRWWRILTDLVPAAILALIVLAARQGLVTRRNAGWFVAAGSLAVSGSVLVTALVSAQAANVVYLVIMTVVNGAIAMSSRQFAVAQTVPVLGALAALLFVPGVVDPVDSTDWVTTVIVALAASIAIHLARARGFAEMARLTEILEQQAIEDPLTGLGTRRAFTQMSSVVKASAEVAQLSMFVVFVDVDGLKQVNDTRGHEVGDTVLVAVTEAMRQSARSRDVLVRWGGDEFAILGIGDPDAARRWQTSVLQRITELNPVPDIWPGTISVGYAFGRPSEIEPTELVAQADADMYANRRSAGSAHS